MIRDKNEKKPDFYAAASLYSLGELSSAKALEVAQNSLGFRDAPDLRASAVSPAAEEESSKGRPAGQGDFASFCGPSLEVSAKAAVLALAQGLLRDGVDPLHDIYDVGSFVRYLDDLLSKVELERAEIFVELGNDSSQLWDCDPKMVSSDAAELREKIRMAAADYVRSCLTEDKTS